MAKGKKNAEATPKAKPKKNAESYFEKKYGDLRDVLHKRVAGVQDNLAGARTKRAALAKAHAEFIKHTAVRNTFIALMKPSEIERAVTAIDSATNHTGKGKLWAEKFTENVKEMARLVDDAKSTYQKFIDKKENEEKRIAGIEEKAAHFHNSCLEKLRELKTEGQKPFQIGSNDTGGDYLYASTPFQCYQKPQ